MRPLGVLLIIAGIVVPLWKLLTLPSAHACAVINGMDGGPPTCHSAVPVSYWLVASFLVLIGVLFVTRAGPSGRDIP